MSGAPTASSHLLTRKSGEFSGTADTIQQAELQATSAEVFSATNVRRAWISLKQTFPLLGSRAERGIGTKDVLFVVEEARLSEVATKEIHHRAVTSANDVSSIIDELIQGPRQLASDLPARLYILNRKDSSDRFHILLHVAHLITDGLANATVLRVFLDYLTSPPFKQAPNLESRLGMAMATESLHPSLALSVPRQRWRRAIAWVLTGIKMQKTKAGSPHLSLFFPTNRCT